MTKDEVDKIVMNLSKFDEKPNYSYMLPYSANLKSSQELRQAEQMEDLRKEVSREVFKAYGLKKHTAEVSSLIKLNF